MNTPVSAVDTDMPTITTKITVGIYDLYLHVGWRGGLPVRVDLVIALHPTAFGTEESLKEASALSDQISFVKGSLEVITRVASVLLERGLWTLDDLCDAWRGTTVFHGGVYQVGDGPGQFASGPLDAAARVIAERKERWVCQMASA